MGMHRVRPARTHTMLAAVVTTEGRTGPGSDGHWGHQPQLFHFCAFITKAIHHNVLHDSKISDLKIIHQLPPCPIPWLQEWHHNLCHSPQLPTCSKSVAVHPPKCTSSLSHHYCHSSDRCMFQNCPSFLTSDPPLSLPSPAPSHTLLLPE